MDQKEILKFCLEKGFLLDKEIFSLFEGFSENEGIDSETIKVIIEKFSQKVHQKIITKEVFDKNKEKIEEIFINLPNKNENVIKNLKIKLGLSIELQKEIQIQNQTQIQDKKEEEKVKTSGGVYEVRIEEKPKRFESLKAIDDVRIVSTFPSISKKIEVKDFVEHFRGRYSEMKTYIQEHSDMTNLTSIGKISGNRQGISIIAMVLDKRTTKNRNILLQLEDPTGKITAIVNRNREDVLKKAEDIALDSVIGVKCSGSREIVFVNDIVFPDSILLERKKAPEEEYALFIADLHVGSKNFMEDKFLKFVNYLNGKISGNKDEIEKIKYLFIGGDLISGLGIYAGQDKDLKILDVEEQYSKVAELLRNIRKEIKIIIVPGNHDALRIMEPQPILDEKYAWPLYDLKNVILTGNPTIVNIAAKENKNFSGFDVLIYHGYSFHYYVDNIPHLREIKATHSPEKIMAYLLKNRHLAPSHTSTLYSPSKEDPLLIRKIPDIFFAGHTHKSAVSYYNNILLISASTWESKTDFQEKMGNEPDFCKVPMFNLKTRAIKILDFE